MRKTHLSNTRQGQNQTTRRVDQEYACDVETERNHAVHDQDGRANAVQIVERSSALHERQADADESEADLYVSCVGEQGGRTDRSIHGDTTERVEFVVFEDDLYEDKADGLDLEISYRLSGYRGLTTTAATWQTKPMNANLISPAAAMIQPNAVTTTTAKRMWLYSTVVSFNPANRYPTHLECQLLVAQSA